MTDSEAFAFHFAELDRRGLDGPVPEGWMWSGNEWTCDRSLHPSQAEPCDIQALTGVLVVELAKKISPIEILTHCKTGRVVLMTFDTEGSVSGVEHETLLCALVAAYWRAQAAPSP